MKNFLYFLSIFFLLSALVSCQKDALVKISTGSTTVETSSQTSTGVEEQAQKAPEPTRYDIPKLIADFEKIETQDQLEKLLEGLNTEHFAVILARMRESQLWIKFWDLNYKSNTTLQEVLKTPEEFTNFMQQFYVKILNNTVTYKGDADDLSIIFSSEPMDKIVGQYCDPEKNESILMPKEECLAAIYLYRANEQNKYCEKIKQVSTLGGIREVCEALVFYADNK